MDKFIEKAKSIKARIAELGSQFGSFDGAILFVTHAKEYNEVVLDSKILIEGFNSDVLMHEIAKLGPIPNLNEISYLLGKMIEAAELRSK